MILSTIISGINAIILIGMACYYLTRVSHQEELVCELKHRIEKLERDIRQRTYNIQANVRHLEELSARVYDLENPNGEEE